MSTVRWDFDLLGILMGRGYFPAEVADTEPQIFTLDAPGTGYRVVVVLDDGELAVHLNLVNGVNVYSAARLSNVSANMIAAVLDAAEADAKAGGA